MADEASTQITTPPRTGDDLHCDDHSIFDLDIATMSDAAFTATRTTIGTTASARTICVPLVVLLVLLLLPSLLKEKLLLNSWPT